MRYVSQASASLQIPRRRKSIANPDELGIAQVESSKVRLAQVVLNPRKCPQWPHLEHHRNNNGENLNDKRKAHEPVFAGAIAARPCRNPIAPLRERHHAARDATPRAGLCPKLLRQVCGTAIKARQPRAFDLGDLDLELLLQLQDEVQIIHRIELKLIAKALRGVEVIEIGIRRNLAQDLERDRLNFVSGHRSVSLAIRCQQRRGIPFRQPQLPGLQQPAHDLTGTRQR